MNNAKHTPGPWEVVGSRICTVANDKERITLAKTEPGGSFAMSEQQEANAHLIAAAPAMYEALQAMVEVFPAVVKMTPYGVSMDISKLHDNAKTALAQAEGRG